MSVGVIKKNEYKVTAKTGGITELKDLNIITGDINIWDLLHGTQAVTNELMQLSPTTATEIVGPEYTIPADGLYWLYCSCRLMHLTDTDTARALIVSNRYTIKINGTILPAFGTMVNECDTLVQFAIPLKKGTRVQLSYWHDAATVNDGFRVNLFGFIQQLNQ